MAPTQEWGTRLEEIQRQLGELQIKLAAQTDAQFGMAKALEQNAQENSADALAPLASQIEQMMGQLTALQTKLGEQASATQAAAPIGDSSAISDKISELVELEGRVAIFISALPGDLRQALRDELQGRGEPQGNALEATQKEIAIKLAGIETCLAATQRAAEATQSEVLKPACEEAPSLPEEIKKQFLDQWFQMSAQIEASRTSMVDSIATKINELESRLAIGSSQSSGKATEDYSLQTQIEKQTEILAELVNTLGLLDAHVQQVKTKMIG
jgi:hypothetical protein